MSYLLKKKLLSVSFMLLITLQGCGVWNNFTAYYNLYYNAANSFEDAEEQIRLQRKELFTLQEPRINSNADQALRKVVEKLSKILQFHGESSFVDDALLMLGKSFFYQQEYSKSMRKFNELLLKYPQSDLTLEARLWTAKCMNRLKDYDAAKKMLSSVEKEAEEQGEDQILSLVFIERISYYLEFEMFSDAINDGLKFVEVSSDGELNAKVLYELGLLYQKLNDPGNAALCFERVGKQSPTYEVDFDSKLQYGAMQRELGRLDESLEILEDLKAESKFADYFDKADLQIGLTYLAQKKYDLSFNTFYVLDSTYKQSSQIYYARYMMGQIMEKIYFNLDSAAVFYDKAAQGGNILEDYIAKAKKKAQIFQNYKSIKKAITQNEKMLYYKLNPEIYKSDSAIYAKNKALADSLARDENSRQRVDNGRRDRREEEAEMNPLTAGKKLEMPVMPAFSADSVKTLLVKSLYDLANLYFTELDLPDSAKFYYSEILQKYPKSGYTARTLYALGSYYLTQNDSLKADSLFNVIYENFKSDKIVNAAADKLNKPLIDFEFDASKESFLEAEKLYKKKEFDKAVHDLYKLAKAHSKSAYAPKSLYTAGFILENDMAQKDSAVAVYDTLRLKYPETVYAKKVAGKLQAYREDKAKQKARQDSIKNAEEIKKAAVSKKLPKDIKATAKALDSTLIIPVEETPADSLKNQQKLQQSSPNEKQPGGQPFDVKTVPPAQDTLKEPKPRGKRE